MPPINMITSIQNHPVLQNGGIELILIDRSAMTLINELSCRRTFNTK